MTITAQTVSFLYNANFLSQYKALKTKNFHFHNSSKSNSGCKRNISRRDVHYGTRVDMVALPLYNLRLILWISEAFCLNTGRRELQNLIHFPLTLFSTTTSALYSCTWNHSIIHAFNSKLPSLSEKNQNNSKQNLTQHLNDSIEENDLFYD
jgi:hypothetical protein